MSDILTDTSAGVLTITLNRVDKKNSITAAMYASMAEALAQATRCGGNPSKEEESAEKAAIANLKKCKEYRTQTGKVFAARAKDLTTVNAEFETSQRLVEQLRLRGEGGGALFTKHAAPFFEWLAASSEEEEEEAEKKEVKAEKKEVKEVKEVKEAKEVKEVKEVDVD